MKGDHMGIRAADPTQRELPLSNWARFSSRGRAYVGACTRVSACGWGGCALAVESRSRRIGRLHTAMVRSSCLARSRASGWRAYKAACTRDAGQTATSGGVAVILQKGKAGRLDERRPDDL